ILTACLFTGTLMAQTPVNKTYPVDAGQRISLRFDYPELIKVTTWDKNEVSITGMVTINGGENDDAFELTQSSSSRTLYIENKIRDLKNLPHRVTVTRGTEKIVFQNKEEYQKYIDANGKQFNSTSWGVDMDIILEIKVPKNADTK